VEKNENSIKYRIGTATETEWTEDSNCNTFGSVSFLCD